MGNCTSTPLNPAVAAHDPARPPAHKDALFEAPFGRLPAQGVIDELVPDRMHSAVALDLCLGEVQALQQRLAAAEPSCPLLALLDACEIVAERFGADAAAIWAAAPGPQPQCHYLLAACGAGSGAIYDAFYAVPPGAAEDGACSGGAHFGPGAPQGSPGRARAAAGGRPRPQPRPPRVGAPCSLLLDDVAAAAEGRGGAPPDFVRLSEVTGLRSFAQVQIGTPSAPLGTLLLASAAPGAPSARGWGPRLRAAGVALLPHVQHRQVLEVGRVLDEMEHCRDPLAAVQLVLASASDYLYKASGMRLATRLALLLPNEAPTAAGGDSGGAAAGPEEALLFQLRPRGACVQGLLGSRLPGGASASGGGGAGSRSASNCGASGGSGGYAQQAVHGSRIGLESTLLLSAVANQKARYVKDCGVYMQNCTSMARDIFTRGSGPVASLVVIPLIAAGADDAYGAFYFTQERPCEFDFVRSQMLGFVHAVVGPLRHKMAAGLPALAREVAKGTASSSFFDGSGPFTLDAAESSSFEGASAWGHGAAPPAPTTPALAAPASAASHSRSGSQRLNTEAMLQVLQQEVRRSCHRASSQRQLRPGFLPGLTLHAAIAHGAGGAVYRATWHRAAAAVKVTYTKQSEREAMRDATEMAVLSAVQHPSIVQVFACHTDMLEVAESQPNARRASFGVEGPCLGLRYRPLSAGEEAPGGADGGPAACSLVIMEFCDRGTLLDAIAAGVFHYAAPAPAAPGPAPAPLPSPALPGPPSPVALAPAEAGLALAAPGVAVDLGAAVDLLLAAAAALQHLHALHLVHGDVKIDNILIKSDPSCPRGYAPKLGGFGRAKVLGEGAPTLNIDAAAANNAAPEMLEPGARVTAAADAYAFGIMMYELYTGRRAFAGLRPSGLRAAVAAGARPSFPPYAHPGFAALAAECWAAEPRARPEFGGPGGVVARLEGVARALALPPAPAEPSPGASWAG